MRIQIDIDTDDWVHDFRQLRARLIRRAFPDRMRAVDAVAYAAKRSVRSKYLLQIDDIMHSVLKNYSILHGAHND
jgi:ribosomal protein L16 Arg81 hydroxylase